MNEKTKQRSIHLHAGRCSHHIKRDFSADAHVKRRLPEREGQLRSQLLAKKSLAPRRRTWGKGQNIPGPHTQSQQRSRGVNPVSNKLGLTPVAPTPRPPPPPKPPPMTKYQHLSHTCAIILTLAVADKHVLSGPQSGALRRVICSP